MTTRRFSIIKTGDRYLPYEVIDSQRYGGTVARCNSRDNAYLLARALNETRPDLRRKKN